MNTDHPLLRGFWTIDQFMEFSTLGRTKVYDEIADGRLAAAKDGRRTLIAIAEALRWASALPCMPARNLKPAVDASPVLDAPTASESEP